MIGGRFQQHAVWKGVGLIYQFNLSKHIRCNIPTTPAAALFLQAAHLTVSAAGAVCNTSSCALNMKSCFPIPCTAIITGRSLSKWSVHKIHKAISESNEASKVIELMFIE